MIDDLKEILRSEYGIMDVNRDTEIRGDLGLTSFELMNLICIVEERYGIEMDEERYRNIDTAGEICDYINELCKGK